MRLERLSCMPALWILSASLAVACFTYISQAQDSPQPQATPPSQDAPQPQENPQQQDVRPEPQPDDSQPSTAQNGNVQEKIHINDRQRTFIVHLPQGYDSQQHHPVVVLLHGLNQDAAEMARLTHFNGFADRDGIIAVYPNALDGRWTFAAVRQPGPYRRGPYRRPGIWGPGYPPPPPPSEPGDRREAATRNQDMQFLHRMLDRLSTHYSVDTRRIYVAGLGDGGFMAIRMGCNMADRIAAIAVVGAAMARTQNCIPSRPIPALFMNGTDDPIVPYDGGHYKGGMIRLLSAEDTSKEWARLNHCSEKPSESKLPALPEGGKDTKVYLFDGCQENARVTLYSVKNGGHTWPGGEQYMSEKEVGKTSHALNANETIWSFLVTKKISGESGIER